MTFLGGSKEFPGPLVAACWASTSGDESGCTENGASEDGIARVLNCAINDASSTWSNHWLGWSPAAVTVDASNVVFDWDAMITDFSTNAAHVSSMVYVLDPSYGLLYTLKMRDWAALTPCNDGLWHSYRLSFKPWGVIEFACDTVVYQTQSYSQNNAIGYFYLGTHKGTGTSYCRLKGTFKNFYVSVTSPESPSRINSVYMAAFSLFLKAILVPAA